MATFEKRNTQLQFVEHATFTTPTYPACKLNGESPYNEKIMSMPSILIRTEKNDLTYEKYEDGTPIQYFFFIYNLENYYHFLYDTLPYLVPYASLKAKNPTLKLLIASNHHWLAFQTETLALLGISIDDCVSVQEGVVYDSVVISPSLTHNGYSNEPPSLQARYLWKHIGDIALSKQRTKSLPQKIYISRRSWIHGDMSNMGTNYTTRRRCMNEDTIVAMLQRYGFEEVFCEKLSMIEKIQIFAQATHVVGCIGGGMANLLFSSSKTKAYCIETPDFLRINTRFVHSMNHTDIQYLPIAHHTSFEGPFSLFTRVRVKESGQIGEIEEFSDGQYTVVLSQNTIAGFSLGAELPRAYYLPFELEPLDYGLNSPYSIDADALEKIVQKV